MNNEYYTEGYAVGYFYGRAVGNDEEGLAEISKRFTNVTTPIIQGYENDFHAGFRNGYARGVTDFVDYDETNS